MTEKYKDYWRAVGVVIFILLFALLLIPGCK